jgi:DNA-binding transcriptional LysR family regulator
MKTPIRPGCPDHQPKIVTRIPRLRPFCYNSSLKPMDLDYLTTFLEIVKLGSFSRAGQKLFRSQPAVSAQIRQLEQAYGQKLFDRVGKSVKLTAAGEALVVYARRLLTLKEESLRAVADLSLSPQGTLNIGANEATCLYLLPDIFADYHRRYPGVQISIYRNFSRKVIEKIEDGSVDVGIVTLPVKSPSLRIHPIFYDRLLLMVAVSNPLAKLKSVTLSEIADQPQIVPKTGFTRQLFDKHFRPYRSKLRITMELASVGMIKRFVAAGLGVSIISERFAKDEVRNGEAKLIPISDADLTRELGLVYRRDRTLPRAAAAFVTLLRQQIESRNEKEAGRKH